MADMNDRGAGSMGGRANTNPASAGQSSSGYASGASASGSSASSSGNASGNQSTPRRRGFAAMDPARQKEIASKGGRAAHEKGTAHEWSREEARSAGRKGGEVVSRDRAHMAAIGREGGGARGANARARAAQANGNSDQLRAPGASSTNTGRPQERERTIPTSSDMYRSNSGGASSTSGNYGNAGTNRETPRGTDEQSSR